MTSSNLVPLEDALSLLNEYIQPLSRAEVLPLGELTGRVLARNIYAQHSTPPFNRAAMDGYAVVSSDTKNASPETPIILTVIEEVFAGKVPQRTIHKSQASQISTGARIPEGADAVIMVENTSREGGNIKVLQPVHGGQHITLAGSDIKNGEMLLAEGTFLSPARIGALASQGLSEVKVYAKPKVAIIPTGEEIVALGQTLLDGQIYDINTHCLMATIQQNGGEASPLPITGDNLEKLRGSLEQALFADLIITTGGSSVGAKDYLGELLEQMGTIKYHGIRIKPGKPSAFAIVRGKPVLGLPGYPTSCLINSYLLLVPVLRKMSHLPPSDEKKIIATLAEKTQGTEGRTTLLPVKILDGKIFSTFKNSGAITSTSQADGYIVVPQEVELPAGQQVEVTIFAS
ncbi:MAG: molybdopterin molybdotransferase MoeA [Dehalococcoidia bacterium]|nr:molybdopterin molybdotransferase MoeA [Dehalococcoidia bacterium]